MIEPHRPAASPVRPPVILIVDDERDCLRALDLRFQRAGYRVITAKDGPTAIRLAARRRPSLIVLDVALPGDDGYEVARQLREQVATINVPIVFYSAKTDEPDVDRSWRLGATAHLGKVAGSAGLLDVVTKTLCITVSPCPVEA